MSKGGRLTTVFGLFLVVVVSSCVGGGRSSDSRRSRWRSQLYEHPRRRSTSAFDGTNGRVDWFRRPPYVVSYLVKDPKTGKWIHDTSWELPPTP